MKAQIRFTGLLVMLAAAALLVLAGSASAQTPLAASKHDLTSGGAGNVAFRTLTGSDYMCKPCHAPHKANAIADMPLSNHTLTSPSGITGYTLTRTGVATVPATIDLVCLGCHDGTVAVDAWGVSAGITFMVGSGGDATHIVTPAFIGRDLSGTHPTSTPMQVGPEWVVSPTGVKLFGTVPGTVKCASCHNPHGNVASGSFFLRATPATLCQACHIK